MEYESVIGLEIHSELSTKTKIFCGCTTEFGGDVNTHCCPICAGFPGTLPILNKKVVEYAVKAGLAMNCEIPVSVIQTEQCLKEGEMAMTCLAPGKSVYGESGNSASLVMALKYREFDMLFTGDVEGKGEEALVKSLQKIRKNWECVKISHHGSKNSTTKDFLDSTSLDYALISAGRNNSYGHPHEETLQRLKVAGSEVLVTKESGAVSVVTDGRKIKLESYCN